MVDLKARTPMAGLLPVEVGAITLTELDLGVMTVVAPYKGQEVALAKALEVTHGLRWPAPNRVTGKAGSKAIWFGRAQALLVGPAAHESLAKHAALVDQSDAWTIVELRGEGAEMVLARLTPIDVRSSVFKRGHTARTELAQMMTSLTRVGDQAFQIMVFRAFGRTLLHEITIAMEGVASRQGA